LANSSQLLVCMGHLDQALSTRQRALREARQLSRPDAVAMAVAHGWPVSWCIRSNSESLLQDLMSTRQSQPSTGSGSIGHWVSSAAVGA
jgi:hypothetical protein